jgi:hypothetical protein
MLLMKLLLKVDLNETFEGGRGKLIPTLVCIEYGVKALESIGICEVQLFYHQRLLTADFVTEHT